MSTVVDNSDDFQSRDESPLSLEFGDRKTSTVWIIPGDDQAKVAVDCTPDDVAIYRLDKRNLDLNHPCPDNLNVVEDKPVLIFPHGDAATEHTVYDRLMNFGRYCEDEGATMVRYVHLSTNLVTHLGDGSLEDRKKRLIRVSKRTGSRAATAKPKGPSAAQVRTQQQMAELTMAAMDEGRPIIDVNDDRLDVINELVDALKTGPDSERIFDLGGELAYITTDDSGATVAQRVDEGLLLNLLARCSKMIARTAKGVNSAWPESKTVAALFGRNRDFRPLRGIAPSPIVRADNTIASVSGYDETSLVLLSLGDLKFDIPEAPTPGEVQAASALILDEWLGDFPFASESDKANTLALILTYPLRELVDLVPLSVISAKSMGTGKSKLLSLIVLLFTGAMPVMDSLPGSEEETRKQITTLLATGSPFLIFDECPEIGGKSINRLSTARTWSDRMLGGNKRATLANRAVIAFTGNNVEVLGDTIRRYFAIELYYDDEYPENRPESVFRHPDVEAWTEKNRGRLLTAVFTLIRAWQVADRPKRKTSFGSFERWEAVIGGVIENAGIDGFLGNLMSHRKATDYESGLWVAHCAWLATTFQDGLFTTAMVVKAMTRDTGAIRIVDPTVPLPPGIDSSPTDSGYVAKLGRLYFNRHGGWSDGFRVGKSDDKAQNKTRWFIEISDRRLAEEVDRSDEFTSELVDLGIVAAVPSTDTIGAGV